MAAENQPAVRTAAIQAGTTAAMASDKMAPVGKDHHRSTAS
jgi:hypothetical protein